MDANGGSPLCPSAQPDMQDARVIGVLSGEARSPRVAYLEPGVSLEPAMRAALGPLQPTEVFRFAARCEEHRCGHFDGQRCTLALRLEASLAPVVERLPACSIRPSCRWFLERGPEICRRCPQVVTLNADGPAELRAAATPPEA